MEPRLIAIQALAELLTAAGVLVITPQTDAALSKCVDAIVEAARVTP